MPQRSNTRNGGWTCAGCKVHNGSGYDFCWKCWKVRDPAKSTDHGSASNHDEVESDDATKAKLKKLRQHLADLRRQAEDPDLEPHVAGNITAVQKEVDELQAAVDAGSDVPRCFSECKLVRERNKTQGERDRTKERVEKQQQEIKEAQEKLDKEQALLARQEDRLQKQNARIEELSVPKAGQGWGAAVAFLEQATKCLRDRDTDPKLTEALRHAQQQQAAEVERAKKAAAEEAAKKQAADAASEAHEKQDKQQRAKRRAEEEIRQELVSFPQGATEQQAKQIMQDAGCTSDQIERHAVHLLPLLAGMLPDTTLNISKSTWTASPSSS